MSEERWIVNVPLQLPSDVLSGAIQIPIPRVGVKAMAVLNSTAATIAYASGNLYTQSKDVITVQPYTNLGLPIVDTQVVTFFWSASSFLSTTDAVTIMFSNGDINASGGANKAGGIASNVSLVGTPPVNINTMPHIIVDTLPHIIVDTLPALAAGTNVIGHVVVDASPNLINIDATISSLITAVDTVASDVNLITTAVNNMSSGMLKAATTGITTGSKISVLTTATVLFNGVITGKNIVIQNQDTSNSLSIGPSTVTVANAGLIIPPGGIYTMDVVSGSNISLYGIGSVALTVGVNVIN